MTRTAAVCLLALLVPACDSGGDAAPPAPPATFAPDVAVTATNAVDFATVGMRSTFDLPNLVYIGAHFLRLPVPQDPNAPGGASPVGLSAEVSGPNGGVAVYTWDDFDGDGAYSTGDVITIDFNAYGDGDFTVDGVMVLEDLSTAGAVTQGGGSFIVDATLRFLNVDYQLGAGTFTMNADVPFRIENREELEIFELDLFEDLFVGINELKENSSWRRYETGDELSYDSFGYSYSPQLDGVVRFQTNSVVYLNTFTQNPVDGFVAVRGTGGTFVEVQSQGGIGCTFPGFPLPCQFDVRVEEDGQEGFESVQVVPASSFLPQ